MEFLGCLLKLDGCMVNMQFFMIKNFRQHESLLDYDYENNFWNRALDS